MHADLLAGTAHPPLRLAQRPPVILVFDSGVGGLTVFAEVRRARPDARLVYAADDAAFPVGGLDEAVLSARVLAVMERLIARVAPDVVVVACGTISTLVLPALRRRFAVPFVGVVPAIKPAAAATRSGMVTVLATPGTVRRDYTRDLVEAYAAGCRVNLVGSPGLAAIAEAELAGGSASDVALAAELAPCFLADGAARTDVVVLACTHYPLLRERFERLAPWPVTWLDPAAAVARRVLHLVGPARGAAPAGEGLALFTSGRALPAPLHAALAARGLADVDAEALPFAA